MPSFENKIKRLKVYYVGTYGVGVFFALALIWFVVDSPVQGVATALWLITLVSATLWLTFLWRSAKAVLPIRLNDRSKIWQDSAELLFVDMNELSPIHRIQHSRLLAHLSSTPTYQIIGFPAFRFTVFVFLMVFFLLGIISGVNTQHESSHLLTERPLDFKGSPLKVVVSVTPPKYTGLPVFQSQVADVSIPEGSVVELCLSGFRMEWRWVGETHWRGERCESFRMPRATKKFVYRSEFEPLRVGTLTPLKDQSPLIEVKQPLNEWTDITHDDKNKTLHFSVSDDYGLASVSLNWTLAKGTGENVRFTDREQIRYQHSAQGAKTTFSDTLEVDFNAFDVLPGDELYVYIQARDFSDSALSWSRSKIYAFRFVTDKGKDIDSTTMPSLAREKGLRSQRQIILDTEKLLAECHRLSAKDWRLASQKIAQDQHVLRLRYGAFLGEESTLSLSEQGPNQLNEAHSANERELHIDELESAHGSLENHHPSEPKGISSHSELAVDPSRAAMIEYGHTHDVVENATLFDEPTKRILRTMLQHMWNAERSLHIGELDAALPDENEALKQIKLLQQAERIYLHKTAFTPTPFDESVRASGEMNRVAPMTFEAFNRKSEQDITIDQWLSNLDSVRSRCESVSSFRTMLPSDFWLWLTEQSLTDDGALQLSLELEGNSVHQRSCEAVWMALRDHLISQQSKAFAWPNPGPSRTKLFEEVRRDE